MFASGEAQPAADHVHETAWTRRRQRSARCDVAVEDRAEDGGLDAVEARSLRDAQRGRAELPASSSMLESSQSSTTGSPARASRFHAWMSLWVSTTGPAFRMCRGSRQSRGTSQPGGECRPRLSGSSHAWRVRASLVASVLVRHVGPLDVERLDAREDLADLEPVRRRHRRFGHLLSSTTDAASLSSADLDRPPGSGCRRRNAPRT